MAVDQQGLLARLVRELVRLPGIGQKTAQRLAFHVLKADREDALRLAEAIRAVKDGLSFCRQCRNIAEGDLCEYCLDPKRDQTRILVVEEPSTLYAIERAGAYRGLYHVLLGALSPLDGGRHRDRNLRLAQPPLRRRPSALGRWLRALYQR